MDASAVSHIAFCVSDIEQSLGFYRDLLGMEVIFDQVQDTTRGGLPHVYQHARQTRRTVHLTFGDNPLHLVMTSHPGDSADGAPIRLDQVGISHFSFSVSDVPALYSELESKGAKLAAPRDAWTNDQGVMGSFYVYDPDGILVQFDAGGGG